MNINSGHTLFFPVKRSVSLSISCLISLKSVNILFLICKKTPHSSASCGTKKKRSKIKYKFHFWMIIILFYKPCSSPLDKPLVVLLSLSCFGVYINWRINGLRVTIPVPRGKKSRPTRFSSTELFPELFNFEILIKQFR